MRQPRAYGILSGLSATESANRPGWRLRERAALVLVLLGAPACFELEIPDYDDGDVVLPGPETPLTDVVVPDTGDSDAASDSTLDVAAGDADAAADAGGRDIVSASPGLSEVQDRVFQVSCTPCHTDRVSGGLSLRSSDQLLASLFSASVQLSSMPRVTPGDLDRSYLWLKVTGAHLEAGGLGEPMPLGETLTREQLELLRRWIEESAAAEPSVAP